MKSLCWPQLFLPQMCLSGLVLKISALPVCSVGKLCYQGTVQFCKGLTQTTACISKWILGQLGSTWLMTFAFLLDKEMLCLFFLFFLYDFFFFFFFWIEDWEPAIHYSDVLTHRTKHILGASVINICTETCVTIYSNKRWWSSASMEQSETHCNKTLDQGGQKNL